MNMNAVKVEPKRGEIWSVKTDRGLKNCIIVSNDTGNKFSNIVLAVDVIEGTKRKPTQMQVGGQVALFERMSTYSTERLVKKVDKVSSNLSNRFGIYIEAVSKEARRFDAPVEQWGAYFIDLGQGVGSEQAGVRLVVVVSNNVLNATGKITVVPATSQLKRQMPTHVDIPSAIGIPVDSTLLLEQMVTLNASAFDGKKKITDIPVEYQQNILHAKAVATAFDVKEIMHRNKV